MEGCKTVLGFLGIAFVCKMELKEVDSDSEELTERFLVECIRRMVAFLNIKVKSDLVTQDCKYKYKERRLGDFNFEFLKYNPYTSHFYEKFSKCNPYSHLI